MKVRNLLFGSMLLLSIHSLPVYAEEEKIWYKSWDEKVGEKAREIRGSVDPDGNLQEKVKSTYESSKQHLEGYYDAAEGYVDDNKSGWKEKGSAALDAIKEKAKGAAGDLKDGVVEGYENIGDESDASSDEGFI
ncbi:MAG: hypothetical protein HOG56_02600 [Gammaproteobacteria bacterium]|jgi:hypothetical protein|nr:hypothetical protein [Gammaproteobacteria bacterium]